KALPKMANSATSHELRTAFEQHLAQTEQHIRRLDQVLDSLDEPRKRTTCRAAVGLIEEGEQLMNGHSDQVLDAALIAAGQKIEHYEMATYGCLRTWARLLDEDDASQLLQHTLDEEGETDHRLTAIAETLNADALRAA